MLEHVAWHGEVHVTMLWLQMKPRTSTYYYPFIADYRRPEANAGVAKTTKNTGDLNYLYLEVLS